MNPIRENRNSSVLSASAVALLLLSGPVFAAGVAHAPGTATGASNATQNQSGQAASAKKIVNEAAAAVKQAQHDPAVANEMKRARGVFIIPNYTKGAAVVGGEGGAGVFLVRERRGWSNPAFYTSGAISVGAQVGGETGPVVLMLMTPKAVNQFTEHNNFSLNANAGFTIVNASAKNQGGFGKGDVIAWSGTQGGFAGASVGFSDIVQNHTADEALYNRENLNTNKIITSHVRSAAARPLRDQLRG